jgi:hypothetical protein
MVFPGKNKHVGFLDLWVFANKKLNHCSMDFGFKYEPLIHKKNHVGFSQ